MGSSVLNYLSIAILKSFADSEKRYFQQTGLNDVDSKS